MWWWIILLVLIILALGGFGHTGYRRGWYGGYQGEPGGGWFGGGLGLVLLIIVLFLIFGGWGHYGGGTVQP